MENARKNLCSNFRRNLSSNCRKISRRISLEISEEIYIRICRVIVSEISSTVTTLTRTFAGDMLLNGGQTDDIHRRCSHVIDIRCHWVLCSSFNGVLSESPLSTWSLVSKVACSTVESSESSQIFKDHSDWDEFFTNLAGANDEDAFRCHSAGSVGSSLA